MSQVIGQVWREVVGCRNWPVMRVPLFIALRRNDHSAGANWFLDGRVMAEGLGRWLHQWAARGVSKILGSLVRHWHPPHEAIRSYLVINLLPVQGSRLPCPLSTK